MNLGAHNGWRAIVAWLLVASATFAGEHSDDALNEIRAIRFLGSVDCCTYPEAQTVLIGALSDRREEVRFAAVRAITRQLQHGKPALDPLAGWRQFPDPQILRQIVRVAQLQHPLSLEELYQHYSQEEYCKRQEKECERKDACCNCCTQEVLDALAESGARLAKRGETVLGTAAKLLKKTPLQPRPAQPTASTFKNCPAAESQLP